MQKTECLAMRVLREACDECVHFGVAPEMRPRYIYKKMTDAEIAASERGAYADAHLLAKVNEQLGRAVPLASADAAALAKFAAMVRVCKLASELCNAVDAAEEDIGGHRPTSEILAELGPACDIVEGR